MPKGRDLFKLVRTPKGGCSFTSLLPFISVIPTLPAVMSTNSPLFFNSINFLYAQCAAVKYECENENNNTSLPGLLSNSFAAVPNIKETSY